MANRRTPEWSLSDAEGSLRSLPSLNEQGRLRLLLEQQSVLTNGDAMAFFGAWADAMCEILDIDQDEIFSEGYQPIYPNKKRV